MSTSTDSRIDNDRTPMTQCDTCTSPVDMSGRTTASAYIHRVESERESAQELVTQLLYALEPYAAMANRYGPEHPDSTVVMTWQNTPVVTLGDLRRAKHYVDLY